MNKEWLQEFESIKEAFPMENVAIAGGCLRDRDNGNEYKDVDIFVYGDCFEGDYQKAIDTAQHDLGYDFVFDREYFEMVKANFKTNITSEVLYVGIKHRKGVEYNIVILSEEYTKEEFLLRLDIGLSRIAYFDKKSGIEKHPHYVEDMLNKVIKIRRCEDHRQLRRSSSRALRLSYKYNDFTIVEPKQEDLPLKNGSE